MREEKTRISVRYLGSQVWPNSAALVIIIHTSSYVRDPDPCVLKSSFYLSFPSTPKTSTLRLFRFAFSHSAFPPRMRKEIHMLFSDVLCYPAKDGHGLCTYTPKSP